MGGYENVKRWRRNMPPDVLRAKRRQEARKYYSAHRDKVLAYRKRWRGAHLEERRAIEADYARKRRVSDPVAQRIRMKKFKARQRAKLISIAGREQPECCELCGESGRTVFDHCHASGQFRGWLCDRCNRVLGCVKDSPALLLKMALYLENQGVENGRVNVRPEEKAAV
jgi:hypothetical protein